MRARPVLPLPSLKGWTVSNSSGARWPGLSGSAGSFPLSRNANSSSIRGAASAGPGGSCPPTMILWLRYSPGPAWGCPFIMLRCISRRDAGLRGLSRNSDSARWCRVTLSGLYSSSMAAEWTASVRSSWSRLSAVMLGGKACSISLAAVSTRSWSSAGMIVPSEAGEEIYLVRSCLSHRFRVLPLEGLPGLGMEYPGIDLVQRLSIVPAGPGG